MKKHCLALAALTLQLPLTAEPTVVESRLEAVSLFRDGARVTRVATVEAPAGKSTLRLENLPSSVDFNGLEASIGDALGVIRNAKLFQPRDPKPSEAVEALREKLEAHRRGTRRVEEDKNIAQSRINFVNELARSFSSRYGELAENGSSLSLEQGLETWALVDETRREAKAAIEEADATLRERAKTEEDLNRELRQATERQAQTRSVAEVEIDLDSAQTIELALSYQALSARWQPHYELRAAPEQGQLDFGYFAQVWQQTGEDWSGVTLSLHTNRANRRGNVPELPPLRLHRYEAGSYPRVRSEDNYSLSPFEVKSQRQQEAKVDLAMAAPPPSQQSIAVDASTVSFQVTLPGAVTVPSAEEASTVPVTRKTIAATFWSEAVPKLQLDAYLRARADNTLELPILPGLALAFVDGKLSSRVTLDKTLPGEELELSLGVDPNIVVERVEGAQEDKDTGFLDKTVTLSRSFANKVTNRHAVAHQVVIVDQFPIATDAKITITRQSPKDSEVTVLEENRDSGIFQWEATLPAGASRSFELRFQVEHPRDWQVGPPL